MTEVFPRFGVTMGSDGNPLDYVVAPEETEVDPRVLDGPYIIQTVGLQTKPVDPEGWDCHATWSPNNQEG